MRSLALLATLALSAAQNQTQGPCDVDSEACRDVMKGNACFAEFIRTGDRHDILQCVDDADLDKAEEELCACYGCVEQIVADWATANLTCTESGG